MTQKYTAATTASTVAKQGYDLAAAASKWGSSALLGASESTQGYEARGRIDVDARTQTAYGTLQSVAQLRLTNATGILSQVGVDAKSATTSQVERAYIRFAGFTAGRSSEITAFMPSNALGFGGHWASYSNGVAQLAYTAVLGGGLSATVGIEDPSDFSNVAVGQNGIGGAYAAASQTTSGYRMSKLPVIAGNVTFEQGWGSVGVAASAIQNNFIAADGSSLTNVTTNATKTGYSVTGNLKLNLPALGAGDQLWLTVGYSDGFNDQTIGWGNFKSSDTKNLVGGLQYTQASFYAWGVNAAGTAQATTAAGTAAATAFDHMVTEQTKAFNVAGVLQHYWTAEWRSNLMASYAATNPGSFTKAQSFAQGGLAKQQFSTVAANLIWSPAKGFDIGLEAQYQNVHTDLNVADVAGAALGTTGYLVKASTSNWGTRLRLERNF